MVCALSVYVYYSRNGLLRSKEIIDKIILVIEYFNQIALNSEEKNRVKNLLL